MLAARRARALGIGLLSGGYGEEELERAGAYRVFEDPAECCATSTRSAAGASGSFRLKAEATRFAPCTEICTCGC